MVPYTARWCCNDPWNDRRFFTKWREKCIAVRRHGNDIGRGIRWMQAACGKFTSKCAVNTFNGKMLVLTTSYVAKFHLLCSSHLCRGEAVGYSSNTDNTQSCNQSALLLTHHFPLITKKFPHFFRTTSLWRPQHLRWAQSSKPWKPQLVHCLCRIVPFSPFEWRLRATAFMQPSVHNRRSGLNRCGINLCRHLEKPKESPLQRPRTPNNPTYR